MRRIPLLILSCLLVCSSRAALADTILSFSSTPDLISLGSMVTLRAQVSGAADLFAFQFDLSYDPAILQLDSVSEGSFLPSVGTTFFLPGSIDSSSGTASFVSDTLLGTGPGASGSGDLVELTFTVLSSGVSPLTLSNVILLDSVGADLPAVVVPGNLTAPEPGMLWLALIGAFFLVLPKRVRGAIGST